MPKIPTKQAGAAAWKQQRVYVTIVNGKLDEGKVVDGFVNGPLCVWYDSYPPASWNVGTVSTGLAMAKLSNQEKGKLDAIRVAEHLLKRVGHLLGESDPASLRAALPYWVKSWCLKIMKARAWVEPDESEK